jgi:hypothetical protein
MGDGDYEIGARPVDSSGAEGPTMTITLRIARGLPAAPTGVVIGANKVRTPSLVDAVELDWVANKEKNVVGYRVYRDDGSPACPTSAGADPITETECVDLTPRYAPYTVRAVYTDANGSYQLGPPATTGTVVPPGPARLFLGTTSPTSTTNCPGSPLRDLVTTEPTGTPATTTLGSSTLKFCSVAAGAMGFGGGGSTATAWFTNGSAGAGQDCTVTAALTLNGAAPTWSDTSIVQNKTYTATPHTFTLAHPAGTAAANSRVNIAFSGSGSCTNTSLVYAGASSPARIDMPSGAPAPNPPTNVTASASSSGGTRISWSAPAAGGAAAVAFYRLYRSSSNVGDRFDRTGDQTTTVLDDPSKAFGSGTQYWVTAVSANLAESTAVQVTG